ncbi:MAG TPA: hypothetical protein VE549_16125 [Myxococcaceae bacterium]|nr:hypothetical protein [Myxococcaceae bacterium]
MRETLNTLQRIGYNLNFWRVFSATIGDGIVNPVAVGGREGDFAAGATFEAQKRFKEHQHPASENHLDHRRGAGSQGQ